MTLIARLAFVMFSSLVSYHITLDTSHVLFVTLVFLSWPSMFLSVFVFFLHYSVLLLS